MKYMAVRVRETQLVSCHRRMEAFEVELTDLATGRCTKFPGHTGGYDYQRDDGFRCRLGGQNVVGSLPPG